MTAANHNFSEIPLVNLQRAHSPDSDRLALAREISDICHSVGFFVLINHGIAETFMDSVFQCSRQLFELPLEEKKKIDKHNSRHFRGWESEGAEYTNSRPDIREQLDLWTEHPARDAQVKPNYLRLLGPNQWPSDSVLPGFQYTVQEWLNQMNKLASELMGLLALGLALEEGFFEKLFGNERVSFAKLVRYPPTPPENFGVNGHHDTGFLTVLATGGYPGLEIQNPAGQWVPAPVVPNSFVINLGEMLQAITGNYYVATPHRVFAKNTRYSAAYFHGPSLETPLQPLNLSPRFSEAVAKSPRHNKAGFMTRAEDFGKDVEAMQSKHTVSTYGEQVWNYVGRSYPDIMRKYYP